VIFEADAEDANECNPDCNGVHMISIPVNMRRLLPKGYSTYLLDGAGSSLEGVSPRRAQVQLEAARALEGQAIVMQRLAARRMGRLPTIGDMVQVKIPDVDRSKLDPPCLTTVVVEVSIADVNVAIMIIMSLVLINASRKLYIIGHGKRVVSTSHKVRSRKALLQRCIITTSLIEYNAGEHGPRRNS
jgi:hypothetical protein